MKLRPLLLGRCRVVCLRGLGSICRSVGWVGRQANRVPVLLATVVGGGQVRRGELRLAAAAVFGAAV